MHSQDHSAYIMYMWPIVVMSYPGLVGCVHDMRVKFIRKTQSRTEY